MKVYFPHSFSSAIEPISFVSKNEFKSARLKMSRNNFYCVKSWFIVKSLQGIEKNITSIKYDVMNTWDMFPVESMLVTFFLFFYIIMQAVLHFRNYFI